MFQLKRTPCKVTHDEFYSDIYDYLVYDKSKNNFEIEELKRIIKKRGENVSKTA